jgi:hypothetical protein
MEKDLIDNDTRHVSRRVAPSLADLNDLSKSLEKSLHDQVGKETTNTSTCRSALMI